MNFISTFDELNKLYEEVEVKKVEEACKEELTEAAADEEIEIIDDEASAEEVPTEEVPAEDPVVGDEPKQVILECDKCGALVIKDEADIVVDDETDLVNVEDECQFCEEAKGFKIVGVVAPYEVAEETEPTEEVEGEEVVDEALTEDVDDKEAEKIKKLLFKELDKRGETGLKNFLGTLTISFKNIAGIYYDKQRSTLRLERERTRNRPKDVIDELIKMQKNGQLKPKTTAAKFKSDFKDYIELLTKKYHQKPVVLKNENECVYCGGDINPEADEYNTVKCNYCRTRYFDSEQYGRITVDCPVCGGTPIDPAEDCKCAYCGNTLTSLKMGKCNICGGQIQSDGSCLYCRDKSKESLKKVLTSREGTKGAKDAKKSVQEDLADVARKVFDKPASIATQQRWEDELNDDSISPARRKHLMKKFAQQRDWEEKHPDKEVK